MRPSWRLSLLAPQTMVPSCALSLARPVLATPMHAIVHDLFLGLTNLGMCHPMVWLHQLRHWTSTSIALMRYCFHIRRLLYYATIMVPPHALASSCEATWTTLRWPRLLYSQHHRPQLLILMLSFLNIGTKDYHPHKLLPDFLSSRNICIASTFILWGRGC